MEGEFRPAPEIAEGIVAHSPAHQIDGRGRISRLGFMIGLGSSLFKMPEIRESESGNG
jgi:hypothetical protein